MLQKIKRALGVLFIERRLPYSWDHFIQRTLHEKPLKKCLRGVESTPPIPCQPEATTELHLVTCQQDTHMAILAIKSLLRFVPDLAIVIHGDESLGDEPISIIKNAIPGTRVITYNEANLLAKNNKAVTNVRDQLPELFQLDSSFKRQKKAWALKIFDFHLFSNSKKVIVLDSDTIFLQKPDEIVEWMQKESLPSFYAIPFKPNLRVKKSLYKKAFPESNIIESFNGGLFGFNKSTLPIEKLVYIAETLLSHPEIKIFGDECVWRFAYSHIDSKHLDYETYPIFGSMKRFQQLHPRRDKFKYMHFLLKHREGLYVKIARHVLRELNSTQKKPTLIP